MVSQKKVLSVKIDPDKYDAVKTAADLQKVPMADIIIQSLDAHNRNHYLQAQNEDLHRRLDDMEKRLEGITGRKLGKSRRLTITVPEEVHAAISDMAHQNRMSKSEFVKTLFQGKLGKSLPSLPA